ncbi:MAG: hypothetical protein O3B37_11405 [Proteobacteria bacterium]|nr:hypothetical protein [Pseudomonadota bacterium]
MFGTKSLFAGLVLSVVAGSNFAEAAQPNHSCTDRTSALTHLSKKYSEEPVAIGLASNGGVVEVLTDSAGSTWSIIITMPDGMACIVASGEHWEPLQPIKAGARI